jgi:tetratricopeptide (TPR) repeat protein
VDDLETVLKWPQAMAISTSEMRAFLACVLLELNRDEQAHAVLTDAFRTCAQESDVAMQAQIEEGLWHLCAWQEKFQQCAYLAERRIEILPKDATGYRQAALSFATLGNSEMALQYADKALSINTNDRQSWGTLGRIYYQQGEFENAIRCFRRAILNPTAESQADAQDIMRCAFLLATCPEERMRNGKSAMNLIESVAAISGTPDQIPQLIVLRAFCAAEMGKTDLAAELMEQAIKIPPREHESREHFEQLRKLFSEGIPYRHDPRSPEKHLVSVSPAGLIGVRFLRLRIVFPETSAMGEAIGEIKGADRKGDWDIDRSP